VRGCIPHVADLREAELRIRCMLAMTMTRPNQKEAERQTLDGVLTALEVCPVAKRWNGH
jgi:hypothetical protein